MVIELLSEYVIFDKKVLNVLEINALQIWQYHLFC